MRRRTTSRATPIASFSACAVPLGVGVSTTRVESTTCTSQSRLPVSATRLGQRAQPLDRGVDLGRVADHEATAGRRRSRCRRCRSAGRGEARSRPSPPSPAAAASARRAASASSSRWLPPARSRPRLILVLRKPLRPAAGIAACRRAGSESTAGRRPRRPAQISQTFQRGKFEHQSFAGLALPVEHLAERRLDHPDLARPARSRPRPRRR